MNRNSRSQIKLGQGQLLLVILLLGATAAPHLLHLQGWISSFFIAMLLLRLLALRYSTALPGRLPLFLLTIGGFANVLLHYPILLGREAGVALLVSMLGLKLMELRHQRDLYVLVFLGYFTLVTQFLYQRDFLMVVYVLLLLVGLTALLVESSRSKPSRQLLRPLRVATSLLLQSLPIAAALFLFFPRFSSPLWDLGLNNSAVTGVSDTISMGSISQLSRSSAVAFRVDFDGAVPEPSKRYWRGPVIWDTDGREWHRGEPVTGRPATLSATEQPVDYEITLEPGPGGWLYTLDLPIEIPPDSELTADYQLLNKRSNQQRLRYRVSSALKYRTSPLSAAQRERGLKLPDNVTPRMIDLVASWQQKSSSDLQLVALALAYFNQQPYIYTLYPPVLGDNPIDEFLFDSRRGFCEHFATSFTVLMRIAGLPTRIVAGYQGGEINPVGDYLVVRQSDAHAWNEVWLQGRGWTRVDPTAAVAPERIEQPLDIDRISGRIGAPVLFNVDSGVLRDLARQISWSLDALNSNWHRWVLGYSKERQGYFMQLLGLGFLTGSKLALGMVVVTGGVVALMIILILLRSRERYDPVQKAYRRFCRKLQRRGLSRQPSEGPKAFAERVIRSRPDLQAAVETITRRYIGIRYGRADNPGNRRRLQRSIRLFHP